MQTNSEIKTIVGIVVVCVVLLGLFVWFAPKGTSTGGPRDLTLLVHDNSHMTGKMGTKVTLVEFGDYQCPACGQVAPFVKQVVDQYVTNPNFNFVFRNFPLTQHANAFPSAEAAESAGAQGKYFQMNELLYKNQAEWSEVADPTSIFVGYAKTLGLDTVKFKASLDTKAFDAFIKADLVDAMSLSLDHTPTFFLNGVEVKDVSSLKAQIDTALTK